MNNIQETSREDYHDSEKTRSKVGRAILQALENSEISRCGMTNKEISDQVGRPINTITPATLSLRNKGMVVRNPRYEKGIRPDRSTGKRAISWVLRSKAAMYQMPPAFKPEEARKAWRNKHNDQDNQAALL